MLSPHAPRLGRNIKWGLDFAQDPALDKLDGCTKADLLLIANFFNISVPLNAREAEIKSCLSEQLVERGIVRQKV